MAVISHAPSPRSKERSTRAYVGNRCEFTAFFRQTLSFAHKYFRPSFVRHSGLGEGGKPAPTFQGHAPEKKCAASPGGTFFILVSGFALSTRRPAIVLRLNYAVSVDSKGKLLVVGPGALQMLARESPQIVAFRSAGTTSRAAGAVSSSFLKGMRWLL